MGIVGTHPGSFRKSGKEMTYRIRNLEEYTELCRNDLDEAEHERRVLEGSLRGP
jgi:hypothetical protein